MNGMQQGLTPVGDRQADVPIGCKRSDIVDIPQDWRVKTIASVAAVKTGPFGSALHERDYVDDGTPIVTVEHLSEHGIIHRNLPLVSNADRSRLKSYGLRAGDIVFSRVGSVDRNSLVREEEDGWLFSGRLLRVRTSDNTTHPPYLSYHFNSEPFKRRVRSVAVGQTMASLNTQILNAVRVVLPATPEQCAIAGALSDVDGLLGALETLTAKKQAIKQAAMQQLLTGKTRLPGFTGEWETKRLGDVASLFKGSGLSKANLTPDGKRRCIHYGELFTTYGERIIEVLNGTDREDALFRSVRNDVLMPTSDVTPNGLATASCILPSDIIIGGDILVIRVLESLLNGEFLAYAVKANRNQVMQLVSGTTVFHLYGRDMANFSFRAPSVAEQTAIVTVFSDMDAEIALLQRRRDKIRVIKQGMMQQLLTGRVRLVKPSQAKACA